MAEQKVDFKTSNYFPAGLIFAGFVILFIALIAFTTSNTVAGIILTFIGVAFISTHYRLEVNFQTRQYKDYVWFFGFRNGTRASFGQLDYIFIKPMKLRKNMNSRISSNSVTVDAFDGYLKIDGKETIHLLTRENKKALMERLNKMAEKLHVKLVDYSVATER